MKKLFALMILSLAMAGWSFSADKHEHKVIPGPLGGKIFEMEPLHVEFFVNKDRKVVVAFYDDKMKPVKAGSQIVSSVAEAKSGKATLAFEKSGDVFLSKSALPDGNKYRVILQIKPTAEAKQQNFRLDFDSDICGECKRAEYACKCDGHQEGGHKH
ncbi:MAG: hypothetical protein JNM63_04390 [Spirochaetia bacterium]|nr:hypothetical protein [Spirochaetia bacterium]